MLIARSYFLRCCSGVEKKLLIYLQGSTENDNYDDDDDMMMIIIPFRFSGPNYYSNWNLEFLMLHSIRNSKLSFIIVQIFQNLILFVLLFF